MRVWRRSDGQAVEILAEHFTPQFYDRFPGAGEVPADLSAALAKFRALIQPIPSNKKGKIQGVAKRSQREYEYEYDYADLAQIARNVDPCLALCGLTIRHRIVVDRDERGTDWMYLHSWVLHSSGEQDEKPSVLPLGDAGDLDPQRFASKLTYWRRYAKHVLLDLAIFNEDLDAAPVSGDRHDGRSRGVDSPRAPRAEDAAPRDGESQPQRATEAGGKYATVPEREELVRLARERISQLDPTLDDAGVQKNALECIKDALLFFGYVDDDRKPSGMRIERSGLNSMRKAIRNYTFEHGIEGPPPPKGESFQGENQDKGADPAEENQDARSTAAVPAPSTTPAAHTRPDPPEGGEVPPPTEDDDTNPYGA